ncbi:MAG: alpha/beta hydrolase, partial [Aliidongia sp.]
MEQNVKSNIIIIIPGTTGSPLFKKGDFVPIWPTQALLKAITAPKEAAEMMGQALYAAEPGWPVSHAPYKQLAQKIQEFAKNQGFTYDMISTKWPTDKPVSVGPEDKNDWFSNGQSINGHAIISWGYDWRQDNLVTAMMLRNFLYNLTKGREIGKISLIGHSMGGLVARTYIESVGKDDPVLSQIDQLITLGTPHLGAAETLSPISNTQINRAESAPFPMMELPDGDELDKTLPINEEFMHRFVNGPLGTSTYQLNPPWTLPNAGKFIKFGTNFYPLMPLDRLPPGLQNLLKSANINKKNLTSATNLFNILDYARTGTPSIQYNCLY